LAIQVRLSGICKTFCEIAKSETSATGLPEAVTLLKVMF
jgi:hypothetical protein